LEGAKMAYEMIVSAFAQGDKEALRPLLAPEVFASFTAVIDGRKKRGETQQSKLVGIRTAEIQAAELEGSIANITVQFVSEFITATIGPKGEVLEGDPNRIQDITDIWAFERDVKMRDPNWKLVATGASD
jgi:predicted lipid-binding transport protein (Tim44 family)